MNIINLTPHAINIISGDTTTTIDPSGTVARVATQVVATDNPMLYTQQYGDVQDLPAPQDDTIYIVSALVLARVPDRTDVYAPLTAQAVRNDAGQIIGVPGLVR
ncbi:hypothetical protein JCM16776_0710 [Leptotrichia shahii]|uniref:Uncharacterized protein n=1 Tax=Leptotrichia shahii TaxID=157691 RepID=A0A510JMD5_9FUSO|nr:hypothetical protein [Leptotrichia shahii]BBM40490.1 hypothetical protein JCM16776_0710 [Leptotrichia shahii]